MAGSVVKAKKFRRQSTKFSRYWIVDISDQGFTYLPPSPPPQKMDSPQNPRRREGDFGWFCRKGQKLFGAKVQKLVVRVFAPVI